MLVYGKLIKVKREKKQFKKGSKEALFIKEKFPEYQGIIEYKIYDIETSIIY